MENSSECAAKRPLSLTNGHLEEYKQKRCLLFDYRATPYLGYYDSEAYHFVEPTKIVKIKNHHVLSSFEPKMVEAINIFLRNHPETEIQIAEFHYANFTYNISDIKKRTNIVIHFLPMQDKMDLKDEKFGINASIYTKNSDINLAVTKFPNKDETLEFNTLNLESESSRVELIFHDQEFLSPNNCAIYINHAYQFISFGSICIYKNHVNNHFQMFVSIFFLDNSVRILKRPIQYTIKDLQQEFCDYQQFISDEYNNFLEQKCSLSLVDNAEGVKNDVNLESIFLSKIGSYEDHFYEFLWAFFDRPQVNNFGQVCYQKIGLKYQQMFLILFIKHLLLESLTSLCNKLRLYGQYTDDFENKTKELLENLLPKANIAAKDDDELEIPVILELIINCLKNSDCQDALSSLLTLDEFFQGYIFERTWTWRGQKSDVSYDYGMQAFVSFDGALCDDYLSIDEKIAVLESFKVKFELNDHRKLLS